MHATEILILNYFSLGVATKILTAKKFFLSITPGIIENS